MTDTKDSITGYGFANQHIIHSEKGLTKREYFAAIAMQGILSGKIQYNSKLVADYAVEYADELIISLNQS